VERRTHNKGNNNMNTVQLFNEAGKVLVVRQFQEMRDAERFAFNITGMAYTGETIARTKVVWSDGSSEEYEF
jgi:hypothetical protein